MKNKQQILLSFVIFSFTIVLTSCDKKKGSITNDTQSREESIISAITSATTGGTYEWPEDYVAIMADFSFPTNGINDGAQIKTIGKFMDDNGNKISIGNISIGTNQIQPDNDNNYKMSFSEANLDNGLNILGSNVNVDFGDNSGPVPLRRVNVYIPKAIYVDNLNFKNSSINKNQNLTIKWNADPNNMFGRVLVQVNYNKGLSTSSAAAASVSSDQTPVSNLQYTVPDNGSFTISSRDLQRFPLGSFVSIYVARASVYRNLPYTAYSRRRTVTYIAITESGSFPLKILNY